MSHLYKFQFPGTFFVGVAFNSVIWTLQGTINEVRSCIFSHHLHMFFSQILIMLYKYVCIEGMHGITACKIKPLWMSSYLHILNSLKTWLLEIFHKIIPQKALLETPIGHSFLFRTSFISVDISSILAKLSWYVRGSTIVLFLAYVSPQSYWGLREIQGNSRYSKNLTFR